MSMWRKTILATALVGAGLTSTAGAAFAGEADNTDSGNHTSDNGGGHEHHGHHKAGHQKGNGCQNDVDAWNGGTTHQKGLLNVDHVQTIAPFNVCGNDVPVNVLGIQVPLQHVSGNAPIGSPAKGHSSNSAES